jgi:hypothetical protein
MLLSQGRLARAKRLLVACELVMTNLLEDAPEVLVALDVLLRDVAFLAHSGRFELVVAVAEDHRPVLALEDVDQLARRRARDERVLDEVQRREQSPAVSFIGMRQRSGTTWLAIASVTSLAGGVAFLVILMRADAADRVTIQLDSGETVTIEYETHDPHDFSSDERSAIAEVAKRTIPDVRRALPGTPASIVLHVSTSEKVLAETGENASNYSNVVDWQVDASRKEGVVGVARSQLRATLFHELHHLVRHAVIFDHDIQGDVVREGLATAFERDFGGARPPWGEYPPEVDSWTREVLALPGNAPRDEWLFHNPDGRRWVGMRVGTYLVDRATRASGKTSADLVRVPTATVIEMALAASVAGDGGE